MRPVDLGAVVEEVAALLHAQAEARDLALVVEPCRDLPHVQADLQRLRQVLLNLVGNALKFTDEGSVTIRCIAEPGDTTVVQIVDTGIGFSRDQHRLLFAEFSRLEQGARMAQGLGLGLSIVERLVAAMGLTLELESTEGKGSRFSLYLPGGKMQKPALVEADRAVEAASLSGLRILCVDNERAVLDAMEGLLKGWGCDVRSARSLREIDRDGLLVGWLPDLVLMDYHLDQTSGLDAVEWLRHNIGGHLPAALVTADRTAAVRGLAEERGITVITKPVKPAALRAAISSLATKGASRTVRRS